MAPADLRPRCGPCGAFFESEHAAREHLQICAAYQPRDAIIIKAPPGGPRGVRRIIIFPTVGALPYIRYRCPICRAFSGAEFGAPQGERRRRRCLVDLNHQLPQAKPKPGRPSAWGTRQNRARSIYADYLSLWNWLQFLAWCGRHFPEEEFQRLKSREHYSLGRVFSHRVKWDANRNPGDLAIALLARRLRTRRSTVEQLIKEGRWWDRLEERFGGEGLMTIRKMTRDRYRGLSDEGRRLIRLRPRVRRLTPAQAQDLWSRLPPAINETVLDIEAAMRNAVEARKAQSNVI